MKEGYKPKYKKLFVAWCELVAEGFRPIHDVDVYRRAYPNQSTESVNKHAYKNMNQLRDLMEFKDYVILYQATPADFMRRFQDNANATKPFVKPNGEVSFIPDNSARNTANKDFSEYIRQQNGDGDTSEENEVRIFIRRTDEGADNGN